MIRASTAFFESKLLFEDPAGLIISHFSDYSILKFWDIFYTTQL